MPLGGQLRDDRGRRPLSLVVGPHGVIDRGSLLIGVRPLRRGLVPAATAAASGILVGLSLVAIAKFSRPMLLLMPRTPSSPSRRAGTKLIRHVVEQVLSVSCISQKRDLMREQSIESGGSVAVVGGRFSSASSLRLAFFRRRFGFDDVIQQQMVLRLDRRPLRWLAFLSFHDGERCSM